MKPIPLFVFAGQSNMVGYRAREFEARSLDPFMAAPNNALIWTSGGYGPEWSAAKALSASQRIAIVKVASNGTNLYHQWNPMSRHELYQQLVDTVRSARNALEQQGLDPMVKAIFWMQGESDSDNPSWAAGYAINLERFVSSLRSDIDATHAQFVFGQIANAGPYTDVVRSQQVIASRVIPESTLVSTDGLERCSEDPIHLDTRGTLDLGTVFAASYLHSD